MRYVLKNQEMQTVDHETIHGIGIPGLVLMERASKAVADKAAQIADHSQRILDHFRNWQQWRRCTCLYGEFCWSRII